MLVPMIVIALGCIVFGVYNKLPLNRLIQPVLGAPGQPDINFAGWPASALLVIITLMVLAGGAAEPLVRGQEIRPRA